MKLKKGFFAVAFTTGCSLLAMHSAHALNGPASIQIDGGPLGPLEMSGGMSGYFYAQSGTADKGGSSAVGDRSTGASLDAALIDLQKNTGILQFNIEVGPEGGSTDSRRQAEQGQHHGLSREPALSRAMSPIAPTNSPITVSAGQFLSLEGYESGVSTGTTPRMLLTDHVLRRERQRASASPPPCTQGPLVVDRACSATAATRASANLRRRHLATYTINSNSNVANIFGARQSRHAPARAPSTYGRGIGRRRRRRGFVTYSRRHRRLVQLHASAT